jgi:GT2 family glycosyltransferase
MSKAMQLELDPVRTHMPGMSPLFRLASQASAVARLVADTPLKTFRAGWYVFDARFAPGEDIATQLVIDYGEGYAWLERLTPRYPDAGGKLRGILAIKREPRDLGLLVGPNGQVPSLAYARLQPVGRLRALVAMLRGIHAAERRAGNAAAFRALRAFMRTTLQQGRKAAAGELVERYEATSRVIANDYPAWIAAREAASRGPSPLGIGAPPVFSLSMILDAGTVAAKRSIQSLQAQSWQAWQLCIAHDRAMTPVQSAQLNLLASMDARIVMAPFDGGTEQSGWLSALGSSTGGYCARLVCGDVLAANALQDMAGALSQHPDAGFLYSDHDIVDATGRRHDPSFKQDWSPDVVCQRDVMLQLAVIKRSLALRMGREAGGDPFDVALRACDEAGADHVVHVPRVLYHRMQRAPRPGTDAQALQALQAHLSRLNQRGHAALVAPGMYRIAYPLPQPAPRVEVLLPTRDQRKLLMRCMEGLLDRTDYPDLHVRIIDNDSREPETLRLIAELAKDPRVSVTHAPGAFNFSRIINQAARESKAPVLCLLNDDVVPIEPAWLREMVSHALRPEIGAVGAFLKFPDGSVQHAGVVTGVGGVAGHVHYRLHRDAVASCPQLAIVRNYSAVTAACMVVSRDRFALVGGFDEGLPVCYNDVDFCLRLRAQGYFNAWTPFAVLSHHESASRGADDTPLKRARHQREFVRMLARWGDRLNRDPAYNANLSLHGEPFNLAHSPRPTDDVRPVYPQQLQEGSADTLSNRASMGRARHTN